VFLGPDSKNTNVFGDGAKKLSFFDYRKAISQKHYISKERGKKNE